MKEIYLDNSATTKVYPDVAKKAWEIMTNCYGNPSSLHTKGFYAEKELTKARQKIGESLATKPEEIIFTSGGTEANNLAIFSAIEARKKQGKQIVTTAIEHPSVLAPIRQLALDGYKVVYIKPNQLGQIDIQDVDKAITEDTILVSMMLVNNEVGSILPIEETAKIISKKATYAIFHVDAVQAFGKIPIFPKKWKIDLFSASAHKMHAPKGVGFLYKSAKLPLKPRVFGGGQEFGLRSGTEALPLIAAFASAIPEEEARKSNYRKIEALRRLCEKKLRHMKEITIHSPKDGFPYILNFSTEKILSETMLHFLAEKNIYVSSGSACAKSAASSVLQAMNLKKKQALTALRISFSPFNSNEEIDCFCEALQEGLRSIAYRPL